MDPEEIKRMLMGMNQGFAEVMKAAHRCGPHLSEKPVLELTPLEMARIATIQSKLSAFERDMKRIASKIQAESMRFWLDVRDTHGMHGRGELVFNPEDGGVYEVMGR